jgi:predicted TIM-barrel fold metal-dependent hydrolase
VVLTFLTAFIFTGAVVVRSFAAQDDARGIYQSTYRIIDVHTHGAWPAQPVLQAQFDVMDAVGIDALNLVLFDPAGWPYKGGWSQANLQSWLQLREQNPKRLNVFGTVDFGRAAGEPEFFRAIVTELQTAAAMGMRGVKIWKNLGMHHRDASGGLLKIDDPRLDPFWAKCGELGLPILIHTADPREYWRPNTFDNFHYNIGDTAKYHGRPGMPDWEELIRQRNHILRKHPHTTFIGAHMASLTNSFDDLAALLDQNPNLVVECAARLRFFYLYQPAAIRDFFIKYQDRVLFGTDGWLIDDERHLKTDAALQAWKERQTRFYGQYLEYFETDHHVAVPGGFQSGLRLKGIRLPPEVLEKFYHRNAERVLRGRGMPTGSRSESGNPRQSRR